MGVVGSRSSSGETQEEFKKNLTDYELDRIYQMSEDSNLYQNLVSSLFPSIHGEEDCLEAALWCNVYPSSCELWKGNRNSSYTLSALELFKIK